MKTDNVSSCDETSVPSAEIPSSKERDNAATSRTIFFIYQDHIKGNGMKTKHQTGTHELDKHFGV